MVSKTLIEIIDELYKLDEDETIYAQKPWSTTSKAIVRLEPDDGSTPSGAEGMDYFLEISIAREVLEGWSKEKNPTLEEKCDRIIYYAEYDA